MHRLELKVPPVVVAALAVGVVFGARALLPRLTVLPPEWDWLAIAFLIPGALLAASGVAQFIRAGTTVDPHNARKASALVTGGLYRITRNPMYLGMLFILAGFVASAGNVAGLIALPAFVAYMNRFQIEPEERVLTDLFGREYLAFTERTRRWL